MSWYRNHIGRYEVDLYPHISSHFSLDQIEISALAEVAKRESSFPLLLGSVKANMGHCEAAAGVLGFIKTLMSLRAGKIPPQPSADSVSTQLPFGQIPAAGIPRFHLINSY
jgi:3-oxoacyl-(acyl-carrier-protein) synthase